MNRLGAQIDEIVALDLMLIESHVCPLVVWTACNLHSTFFTSEYIPFLRAIISNTFQIIIELFVFLFDIFIVHCNYSHRCCIFVRGNSFSSLIIISLFQQIFLFYFFQPVQSAVEQIGFLYPDPVDQQLWAFSLIKDQSYRPSLNIWCECSRSL